MLVRPLWKQTPFRSEDKRDFVRSLPCVECCLPPRSEAHHIQTGGLATKCGDDLLAPLCPICHKKADKSPEMAARLKPIANQLHAIWIKTPKGEREWEQHLKSQKGE